jgi:hypothetical protein
MCCCTHAQVTGPVVSNKYVLCVCVAHQSNSGLGRLRVAVSRSHTDRQRQTHTHTQSVGLLWTCDRPVAEVATYTTNNTRKRRTFRAISGIRTGYPSNRAAADLRDRPRGHRDRHVVISMWFKFWYTSSWMHVLEYCIYHSLLCVIWYEMGWAFLVCW